MWVKWFDLYFVNKNYRSWQMYLTWPGSRGNQCRWYQGSWLISGSALVLFSKMPKTGGEKFSGLEGVRS
jgi:hypothetical protein